MNLRLRWRYTSNYGEFEQNPYNDRFRLLAFGFILGPVPEETDYKKREAELKKRREATNVIREKLEKLIQKAKRIGPRDPRDRPKQ